MWSGMSAPRVMALFFVLPVLPVKSSSNPLEGEAAYFRPTQVGTSVPRTLPARLALAVRPPETRAGGPGLPLGRVLPEPRKGKGHAERCRPVTETPIAAMVR